MALSIALDTLSLTKNGHIYHLIQSLYEDMAELIRIIEEQKQCDSLQTQNSFHQELIARRYAGLSPAFTPSSTNSNALQNMYNKSIAPAIMALGMPGTQPNLDCVREKGEQNYFTNIKFQNLSYVVQSYLDSRSRYVSEAETVFGPRPHIEAVHKRLEAYKAAMLRIAQDAQEIRQIWIDNCGPSTAAKTMAAKKDIAQWDETVNVVLHEARVTNPTPPKKPLTAFATSCAFNTPRMNDALRGLAALKGEQLLGVIQVATAARSNSKVSGGFIIDTREHKKLLDQLAALDGSQFSRVCEQSSASVERLLPRLLCPLPHPSHIS